MQEMKLYEYAVVRFVPRVEREEFINLGVVLFCKEDNYLALRYWLDELKVKAFFADTDVTQLCEYLCSFDRICKASPGSGAIGLLPAPERFRWLTATRSTVLQASKVHPGLCEEPEKRLGELFQQLVL